MSLINIKPYEISVWTEKQIYYFSVTENGQTTYVESPIWLSTNAEREVTLLNEYMQETKVGVIGANDMDAPIRALNPIFKVNINGSHTLTFDIYMRYTDDDGTEHDNPWIGYLCNERKVKLSYDGEWYDFVIKEVREDSKKKTISYSCTDVFIEDLSKIGFNIEMKTDLENNMGTVQELGETILLETPWTCAPTVPEYVEDSQGKHLSSDVIRQYNNEALFVYITDEAIDAKELLTNQEITIPANRTIYICYSSLVNNEANPEFFYREDGQYVVDDSGLILNGGPYRTLERLEFGEPSNYAVSTQYRGNKLVAAQRTKYIESLDKYCQEWSDDNYTYYGYQQTTYAVGENIQQMLNNNQNYISIDGWSAEIPGEGQTTPSIENIPIYTESSDHHQLVTSTQLRFTYHTNSAPILNSGPYDNRAIFQEGLIEGDSLILGIKYDEGSFTPSTQPAENTDKIQSYLKYMSRDQGEQEIIGNFVPFDPETDPMPEDETYNTYAWYKYVFGQSLSYDELMAAKNWTIQFTAFLGSGSEDRTITCSNMLLFRKMTYSKNNHTYLTVPDLHSIQPVQTRYFLINSNELSRRNSHIRYAAVFNSAQEASLSDYSPVIDDTKYEKIRSIEAEKSNCFNLLQSLCETFECWVVFYITHNELGYTGFQYYLTQDNERQSGKVYYKVRPGIAEPNLKNHTDFCILKDSDTWVKVSTYERKWDKYVLFREYISRDNYAGFRPSINLIGTQRNIISNDLVTKLIVTPNANTHATDGFCSIQLAELNETGENCIFNFDYFIQQKLIDKSGLYRDLYNDSQTEGIGYLRNLKQLNADLAPLISEQVQLNTVLMRSKALYQTYSISSQEAHEQFILYQNYLVDNGYGNAEYDQSEPDKYPTIIKNWLHQRDLYQSRELYYAEKAAEYHDAVNTYETRLTTIKATLSNIEAQKRWLNREFNTKYARFIREGNWMDQDYIDPELYYLDAMGVSYNSAFPRVSYTFSVIAVDGLEEYVGYTFRVGDKTYVEDTDFFGWKEDGVTPFHQEVIVSAISYTLDNPAKNSITVQNFKDQFDSLFQRITASTQSLQYSEGGYARAAAAIRPDKTISEELMNRALNENSAIISNAADQSVNWGTDGITISSLIDPGRIVRLVNGGIALTEDGGTTWTTGITAKGINAKTITTGTLDTSLVRVYSGSQPAFVWSEDGLYAYKHDGDVVNEQIYVRFDHDGIIGFNGHNRTFSLTYDGLGLSGNGYTMTELPPAEGRTFDDSTVYYERATYGNGYFPTDDVVPNPEKTYYYKTYNDLFFNISVNSQTVCQVADLANPGYYKDLRKVLWMGNGNSDGFKQIWTNNNTIVATTNGSNNTDGSQHTKCNFVVFEDGTIYAHDGIFEGTLYANKLAGALTAMDNDSWLIGAGLCIGKGDNYHQGPGTTSGGEYALVIEPSGYIHSEGSVELYGSTYIRAGRLISENNNPKRRVDITDGRIYFTSTVGIPDSYGNAYPFIGIESVNSLGLGGGEGAIVINNCLEGLRFNNGTLNCFYGANLPTGLTNADEGRIFFLVEE